MISTVLRLVLIVFWFRSRMHAYSRPSSIRTALPSGRWSVRMYHVGLRTLSVSRSVCWCPCTPDLDIHDIWRIRCLYMPSLTTSHGGPLSAEEAREALEYQPAKDDEAEHACCREHAKLAFWLCTPETSDPRPHQGRAVVPRAEETESRERGGGGK